VAQFLGLHQSFDGDRVSRLLVMQKLVEPLPKLLSPLFRSIGTRFRCVSPLSVLIRPRFGSVGPLLRLIGSMFRLIACGGQGGYGRLKGLIWHDLTPSATPP
jgi:hypothetical protein